MNFILEVFFLQEAFPTQIFLCHTHYQIPPSCLSLGKTMNIVYRLNTLNYGTGNY